MRLAQSVSRPAGQDRRERDGFTDSLQLSVSSSERLTDGTTCSASSYHQGRKTRGLKVWSQAHGGFYGGCEAVRMCQGLAGRCIHGECRPGPGSGVMADEMRLALASVPQTSYLHQSNWIKAANKSLYLYDWEGATVLKTLTRAIVALWIGLFVLVQLCACRVPSCHALFFFSFSKPSPLWELIGIQIYTNNSKFTFSNILIWKKLFIKLRTAVVWIKNCLLKTRQYRQ